MAQQTIGIGAAPNDGTGDPIRDAFDKCNDNFTELYTGLTGLLDFKGSTDCSTNPNYPAASKGDFYVVSVAGKIGGASGTDVEVGDAYFAEADNAGGTQAAVGTDWSILQGNTTGAGAGVDVQDETTPVLTASTLNFTGAGVVATDAGGGVATITIAGGGISGIDVEDEGVAEATGATTLNFTGAGVTATDMGAGVVDVDVPGGGDLGVLHVQDQKASGTDGGTFTAGAWQTRTLDDVVLNTITGASVATNQITLPAGTYDIVATAQAFRVNRHQAKLYNVTDTADIFLGTSEFADSGPDGSGSDSFARGRFTLAGVKAIELQHRCETTGTTTGFGVNTAWGVNTYSDVFIKRVA